MTAGAFYASFAHQDPLAANVRTPIAQLPDRYPLNHHYPERMAGCLLA